MTSSLQADRSLACEWFVKLYISYLSVDITNVGGSCGVEYITFSWADALATSFVKAIAKKCILLPRLANTLTLTNSNCLCGLCKQLEFISQKSITIPAVAFGFLGSFVGSRVYHSVVARLCPE